MLEIHLGMERETKVALVSRGDTYLNVKTQANDSPQHRNDQQSWREELDEVDMRSLRLNLAHNPRKGSNKECECPRCEHNRYRMVAGTPACKGMEQMDICMDLR